MGTTAGDKALEFDYPVAFGNAFSKTLETSKHKFRYLHLSGAATERDQEKPLWFKQDMRRIKVSLSNSVPIPSNIHQYLMLSRELRSLKCSTLPRNRVMKASG